MPTARLGSLFFFAATALASFAAPADAGVFTGTFEGVFTNPVPSGFEIDVDGSPLFFDNSATAVYSGVGTSILKWGSGDFAPPNESTVSFTGFDITNAPANTEIALGTFFFENGSSFVDTSIFGADFTISLSGGPAVNPLVSQVGILTTVNAGTDPFQDADFLSFNTFPNTFHVFEGDSATATLFGMIVGDPEIRLTRLELQSGGGFIGGPFVPVPEPSTFTIITSLVICLGLVRGRPILRRFCCVAICNPINLPRTATRP